MISALFPNTSLNFCMNLLLLLMKPKPDHFPVGRMMLEIISPLWRQLSRSLSRWLRQAMLERKRLGTVSEEYKRSAEGEI